MSKNFSANTTRLIEQITPLVLSIELRDAYTKGHSRRVALLARLLADKMGQDEDFCDRLYLAGLLHDLGKIGIPDEILLKPGRLSKEEFDIIRLHSTLSAKIVENISGFEDVVEAVKHHHENYSGNGYPDALAKDAIPLMSQILSVVDVFDALTTRRVYRDALDQKTAFKYMDEELEKGKFNPAIYAIFKDSLDGFKVEHKEELVFYPELEKRRDNFLFKDQLTRLLNREALLAYVKIASNRQKPIWLAQLNIKNFASYNKLYGLERGDNLLCEIATIADSILKSNSNFGDINDRDIYLFKAYADRFFVLSLSRRSEFLEYRLKNVIETVQKNLNVALYLVPILNGETIKDHVEQKIGYLL